MSSRLSDVHFCLAPLLYFVCKEWLANPIQRNLYRFPKIIKRENLNTKKALFLRIQSLLVPRVFTPFSGITLDGNKTPRDIKYYAKT